MKLREQRAKTRITPKEIELIRKLWKTEKKTGRPPWAVGANLVKANIDWMDEKSKGEIRDFAKKHRISFEDAVKKHLEAARWIEYQAAKNTAGISKTGDTLPLATFQGLGTDTEGKLASTVFQLSEGRAPMGLEKMDRLSRMKFTI